MAEAVDDTTLEVDDEGLQVAEGMRRAAAYATDPDFVQDVVDVIQRAMDATPVTETLDDLNNRITAYFDGDTGAGYALLLALSSADNDRAVAQPALAALTPEELQALMRAVGKIRALRGSDVDDIAFASGADPDNWSVLNFTPQHNPFTDVLRIEVGITKISGETVTLAGPPVSLIRLMTLLVERLTALAVAPATLADTVDDFLATVDAFRVAYTPAEAAPEVDAAAAAPVNP
jgi:hypothetical protein